MEWLALVGVRVGGGILGQVLGMAGEDTCNGEVRLDFWVMEGENTCHGGEFLGDGWWGHKQWGSF